MPTFKVTILVDEGLSLGSILMTKHVELLHIEEIPHKMHVEKGTIIAHEALKLLGTKPGPTKNKSQFHHPSGKTVMEFVLEYIESKAPEASKWVDMSVYIESLGFHKSSINNGISRLIEKKMIKRVATGEYKLVK